MVEVGNELMMAVLVASTAFAGLTGVVIWQVMQNGSVVGRALRWCLGLSFFLGTLATLFAILWFMGIVTQLGCLAPGCVVLQIYTFSAVPARFICSIPR